MRIYRTCRTAHSQSGTRKWYTTDALRYPRTAPTMRRNIPKYISKISSRYSVNNTPFRTNDPGM
ncbi:uncharacterized protein LAESUDRAFT_729414 [Laetiporus sulphureus 93-53]|uniref:Uncharacterized protein n=1 Tax=Laetiporus sulphureus 93-53 TaxID=1314785 RepID=A0A165CPA8_9APHY|nr:uncharacterized protein LAESUDRAFT_729414 [Laetiporus sulphureus 93-53]KZT03171.1 hypothetical protein LAESUDRAFT_729414 [Laetiporus sulphureus 93-53]